LGVDFSRVACFRPGYGYAGIPDPFQTVAAPAESGIYQMDIDTGEHKLLVSCAQIAGIPGRGVKPEDRHYLHHVQWSPDGKRFLFLDRGGPGGMNFTRMFTAAAVDGADLRLVDYGSSHYQWRDPTHIIIWNNGYRLFADDGSARGELLWQAPNGHESYLPDLRRIVTDSYPFGEPGRQIIYLVDLPAMKFTPLGVFPAPPAYRGEWRCDTHPRLSRDAKRVCFDSAHESGRQMYLMEIGPLLDSRQ
jgi:hypothetical protein